MIHDLPLVSIVTPVLNGQHYIRTCIESVLKQSYPNIEHLFIDGGSHDRSLEIIEHYRRLHPTRIRVISEPDKCVGDAVNKGLKLAKGDILAWIDTDDYYNPDAVKTVVDFFTTNRSALLVYGGCDVVDSEGKPFNEFPVNATYDREGKMSFLIKDFELKEALEKWCYIVFCATFYRRQLIDAVGGFNDLGNDLDFWIRVDKHFTMYHMEEILTNWRLHRESISMKRSQREHKIRYQRIKEDWLLCLKYGGNLLKERPARFYPMLFKQVCKKLKRLLGFSYPFFWRNFVRVVKGMDYLRAGIRWGFGI